MSEQNPAAIHRKERAEQQWQELIARVPKDELELFYKNHTEQEICDHFIINRYKLYKLKVFYGLSKSSAERSAIMKRSAKDMDRAAHAEASR